MVDVPGSTCDDAAVKRLVDEASAAVLINHVEPKDDMIAERQRASFDSTALSVHLNGGTAKLQRKFVASATSTPAASHHVSSRSPIQSSSAYVHR
jgi:hypothetical protein